MKFGRNSTTEKSGYHEPLYLVSNMATAEEACRLYEKRFRIETFFSDQKRPFRPFSKRFVRNGAKPGIHSRREAQQLQNPLLQGTQSRQMAVHAVDPLNHRQRHLLKRFE